MVVEVTPREEKIIQEPDGSGAQGFMAENTAKSDEIITITYYNIANI